ncbi:hypothetical protein MD484_g8676, partial [Candolleomyces efflorescens]
MLEISVSNKELEIAALAISDPPNERFYIFVLLKNHEIEGRVELMPVKATEASDLDTFIRTYA